MVNWMATYDNDEVRPILPLSPEREPEEEYIPRSPSFAPASWTAQFEDDPDYSPTSPSYMPQSPSFCPDVEERDLSLQDEVKTLRAEVAMMSSMLRTVLDDNVTLRNKIDSVCKRKRNLMPELAAKRAVCDHEFLMGVCTECQQNK